MKHYAIVLPDAKLHAIVVGTRQYRAGGGLLLTPTQLNARKGDANWCQCCLKRHVSPGYLVCYWCAAEKRGMV